MVQKQLNSRSLQILLIDEPTFGHMTRIPLDKYTGMEIDRKSKSNTKTATCEPNFTSAQIWPDGHFVGKSQISSSLM